MACDFDPKHPMKQYAGTKPYMAPEAGPGVYSLVHGDRGDRKGGGGPRDHCFRWVFGKKPLMLNRKTPKKSSLDFIRDACRM